LTKKKVATTSIIEGDDPDYPFGATEEVKLPKCSKMVDYWPPQPAKGEPITTAAGGKIAKLIATLADDDPTSAFDNSVPSLFYSFPTIAKSHLRQPRSIRPQ
jgi:hypothetical protein